VRRNSPSPSLCPAAAFLEVFARPWTLHILWALSTNGPTRFGALRRQIDGISSRVLTERLRLLEQKGFIYRDYQPTIPPSVTYGFRIGCGTLRRCWPNWTIWRGNGSQRTPLRHRARVGIEAMK
jgi:DNA-binding HxlR family transcriptional regulator